MIRRGRSLDRPKASQSADKPNSVENDHSSGIAIARGLERPTRWLGTGSPHNATLFGLAPCGVLPATDVTAGAVRSYRTISPLPRFPEAVYFLCHYSVKLPCPGVTRRTALWSSDFPPASALSATARQALSGLPRRKRRSAKAGDRLADCDKTIMALTKSIRRFVNRQSLA